VVIRIWRETYIKKTEIIKYIKGDSTYRNLIPINWLVCQQMGERKKACLVLLNSLIIIRDSDVHVIVRWNSPLHIYRCLTYDSDEFSWHLSNTNSHHTHSLDKDCRVFSEQNDAGKHITMHVPKFHCLEQKYCLMQHTFQFSTQTQANVMTAISYITVACFCTIHRRCHTTRKFYQNSCPDLCNMYTKLKVLNLYFSWAHNQSSITECSYFQLTAYSIHRFPY
jgi:hypothetical protein